MSIESRSIDYEQDGQLFEGVLVRDATAEEPQPLVLVAHAWGGIGAHERDRARALAELGCAAFCLDLYGKGQRGSNPEENAALMQPLMQDRPLLQRRLRLGLAVGRGLDGVDPTRVAAIGFCFGGLCVLDLARIGADVLGVVPFHGLFQPPGNTEGATIRARVLALHGWDDPMVPPEQVTALAAELTAAGADWQLHAFGGTVHGFSNPAADDRARGVVYAPAAADRAWRLLSDFLAEIF